MEGQSILLSTKEDNYSIQDLTFFFYILKFQFFIEALKFHLKHNEPYFKW